MNSDLIEKKDWESWFKTETRYSRSYSVLLVCHFQYKKEKRKLMKKKIKIQEQFKSFDRSFQNEDQSKFKEMINIIQSLVENTKKFISYGNYKIIIKKTFFFFSSIVIIF